MDLCSACGASRPTVVAAYSSEIRPDEGLNVKKCSLVFFRMILKSKEVYYFRFSVEPDYDFEKPLTDADAYEKETAEFECEVNDDEAPVQWFREDKVCHRNI